jgi:N-acetylglucosamine kinase-like BadF-type ATPase
MSYQIIADSGSTKTDWVLVHNDLIVVELTTQGLNPYSNSFDDVVLVIQQDVYPLIKDKLKEAEIQSIYFYGSGCGNRDMQTLISDALKMVIPCSNIEVYHDMLGSARALCGREEGIACILGTGSNSCLYNGTEIVDSKPAPGYVLGDNGGGAHMGKQLLMDFINDEMPNGLKRVIETELSITIENIYENVYKRKLPNRYLASFMVFIKHELNGVYSEYLTQLVENSFQTFFDKHILKYTLTSTKEIHSVGSVGFYFRENLHNVATKNGYTLGKVIKSPIVGLIEYHTI